MISPEEAVRIARHIQPHDTMALINMAEILVDILHRSKDPQHEITAGLYEHMLAVIKARGLQRTVQH